MSGEAMVRKRFEVIRSTKRTGIRPEDFLDFTHQSNLFAHTRRGLMIFVYFPDVSEQEFRLTLQYAKPSHVIELRSTPRFDIGTLNRRMAFHAFESQNSRYVDLGFSPTGINDWDRVLGEFKSFLKCSFTGLDRPWMLLMNRNDAEMGISRSIRQLVSSLTPDPTEVFEVPHFCQV